MIHRIEFYGSVVDNDNTHKVGKSGMVVVRLAKIIPKHKKFKLYFDNWFNSPELLVALAKDGIQSIGTLQPNRAKGLVFSSGPSTMPRGTFEVKAALVDGVDVYAIRWMDNRYVHLLSTFCTSLPVAELNRFDRKRRQYIKVTAPAAILAYNNHMGHVDEVNSYIARYRMTTQTRARYYIFLHFVNMIATNFWAVYRRDCELDNVPVKDRLSLFAFKSQLASSLMRVNVSSRGVGRRSTVDQQIAAKRKRGGRRTPTPAPDIRTDNVGHWPVASERGPRCKLPTCEARPVTKCEKCDVFLCITAKNCLKQFHGV